MSSQPLLRCDRLEIGWTGRAILPPIDLVIQRGELLVVIGPNGAGKSTWLKTMLGLVEPVAGGIERLSPRVHVTYIPQGFGLDPVLPVTGRDIVGWARLIGWSFLRPRMRPAERVARDDALRDVGMAAQASSAFSELSEGQKQRLLFARLLASTADIGFLDEPTAAMDIASERDAFAHLHALARDLDMAVVAVSHHVDVALAHADRVMLLDRDEPLVMCGPPADVTRHPAFVRLYGKAASHVA